MAIEVELKARVEEPEDVERLLEGRCGPGEEIDKADEYFRGPPPARQAVRLRQTGETVVCTFKDKTISAGIEVNREHEFSVSDLATARELLERLGCVAVIQKHKRGLRFAQDEMVFELVHVEHLGWFLEIEVVLPNGRERRIEDARAKLRRTIHELGIHDEAIESTPYTTMLGTRIGVAVDL